MPITTITITCLSKWPDGHCPSSMKSRYSTISCKILVFRNNIPQTTSPLFLYRFAPLSSSGRQNSQSTGKKVLLFFSPLVVFLDRQYVYVFVLFFRFVTVLCFCFFLSVRLPAFQLDEYLSDDFLFPMTSRLSYASSPESDLDLSPEPRAAGDGSKAAVNGSKSPPSPSSGGGRMVKSSSDPSIATQDDLGVSGLSGASAGGLLNSISPAAAKFLSPHPINSLHPVSFRLRPLRSL